MTDFIEDPYIGTEFDEIFNDWYEIEGARKIKELSRQLRTFFNYKTEVIRYRFRTYPHLAENYINPKFFSRKQEIETLTHEFITLLKKLKNSTQTLEEGIRSLFFNNSKKPLNKLSEITEKLSIFIDYLSEENIHNYPRFLKFVVVLAKNICLVKKYLYVQFSEFYSELEINYHSLEGELDGLLEKIPDVKIEKPIKQLEERLTT
ncbi:MAG: hypothetical protein E3J90_11195 [Promethearchaeota archaeon]|nr:MAG: hypothetical protein E3J90_11195 [Candidatus Lokiarchaeota archaeon]